MSFELLRADKELFAVYHTIYSAADLEMHWDWQLCLDDTLWTDDCFFVTESGRKLGGVIITRDRISHPFLIPPFCDRVAFWSFLLKGRDSYRVRGLLDVDAAVLPLFGRRPAFSHHVMCRPADTLPCVLPVGFSSHAIDSERDAEKLGVLMQLAYAGGICEQVDGVEDAAVKAESVRYLMRTYEHADISRYIVDDNSGCAVALCIAGKLGRYVEVGEICTLPEYKGRRLAEYLLCDAVSKAVGIAPYVKLFVHEGNSGEYLYRKCGFMRGPRFTDFQSL